MSTKDLHRNHQHFLATFFERESVAMVAEPNVDALAIPIHPETLRFSKELMGIFLQAAEPGDPG